MRKHLALIAIALLALAASESPAQAMHISEGILPASRAAFWFVAAIPFVAWGLRGIQIRRKRDSKYIAILSLVGAAVFVISAMPIPVPLAGTCSHPCGTGLAAIIVGPGPSVVIATVALLFQALFMSHGGLTTLGANIFTMGVMGSFTGWAAFRLGRQLGLPIAVAAFACGIVSDWVTYLGTSGILAEALSGPGEFAAKFAAIILAFVPSQVPLGVLEGVLSAMAYRFILSRRPELLQDVTALQEAVQ